MINQSRKQLSPKSFAKGVEIAFVKDSVDVGFFCPKTGKLLATINRDDLFDADGMRFGTSGLKERCA